MRPQRHRVAERIRLVRLGIGLGVALVLSLGATGLIYFSYVGHEPVQFDSIMILWPFLALLMGLIFPHRIALVLSALPWPVGFVLSRFATETVDGFLGSHWWAEGLLSIGLGALSASLGIWLNRAITHEEAL